jgi:hypothetical protein
MEEKQRAVLMGPFVGELYWEAGRFAPMLPHMKTSQFRGQKDIKYIILTREDRFDLYGKYADILVPLRVDGDYTTRKPECFRLIGLKPPEYVEIAKKFKAKYADKYKIIKHIYPDIKKPAFTNKNQFHKNLMIFSYKPRQENYDLVEQYLPNNGKPLVILSPRFRNGFKRNWNQWPQFYDLLVKQKDLMRDFQFIVCGKKGEYIPDKKVRFLDINEIKIGEKSSLVGILLVILERAFFTFGSQSAIPNLSLLHKVDVLEFGCQKSLHTKTYNIHNTPITFFENKKYDIDPQFIIKHFRRLLYQKKEKTQNG